MTTEIRDLGDGKQVVVYTENDALYNALKKEKEFIKEVPYSKGIIPSSIGAVDLYFPKAAKARLLKIIKKFEKS